MDTEEKKITENNTAESTHGNGKKNSNRSRHGNRNRNRRPDNRDGDAGQQPSRAPGKTDPSAAKTDRAPADGSEKAGNPGGDRPNGNRHGKNGKKGRGANHQRPRDTSAQDAGGTPDEPKERKAGTPTAASAQGGRKQANSVSMTDLSAAAPEKKAADSFFFTEEPEVTTPDPTLDAVFGTEPPKEETPVSGTEVVGVHFPQGGKVYWFDPVGNVFAEGSKVIVETARGTEMGEIAVGNRYVSTESIVPPLRPIIRAATQADTDHEADNAARCENALKICAQKVEKHGLGMKLVGAQYTFDNAKLIFYFTAAARVDFRELVKDLASEFRTRIELRQIGIRDEAKMLGGRGICGRKLCCSSFLPNYAQVSVKMAKEQGLSLNSSKISGNCGRLMCCLKYEQSTYDRELDDLPAPDSIVDTPDGKGVVTEVKPISQAVKVKIDDKPEQAPRQYPVKDIKIIRKVAYRHDDTSDTEEEIN